MFSKFLTEVKCFLSNKRLSVGHDYNTVHFQKACQIFLYLSLLELFVCPESLYLPEL